MDLTTSCWSVCCPRHMSFVKKVRLESELAELSSNVVFCAWRSKINDMVKSTCRPERHLLRSLDIGTSYSSRGTNNTIQTPLRPYTHGTTHLLSRRYCISHFIATSTTSGFLRVLQTIFPAHLSFHVFLPRIQDPRRWFDNIRGHLDLGVQDRATVPRTTHPESL